MTTTTTTSSVAAPRHSLSDTLTDSATMLRRTLRHALRYPSLTVAGLGIPVIMLLLFAGVLGRTLGAGLGSGHGGIPGGYINYVAPGVLMLGVAGGCMATAVSVCVDMTEGIVDRFRTMAIARSALLTGHVIGSMIQTVTSTALVIGVAMLMGFRPTAGPVRWLAAAGLLVLLIFALTWLAVGIGLTAKSPEAASNTPMLIQFLPFLGSTFVPAASMPAGVRQFAEYQPFTPVNETLRGLLLGTPIGHDWIVALAWCVAVALVGYLWARAAFRRDRAH
ncbi:MAG TPA: ABC transporter permease [Actinocrinis sp.]|nr:ABC transporter permease [Actinocrinis sp.]